MIPLIRSMRRFLATLHATLQYDGARWEATDARLAKIGSAPAQEHASGRRTSLPDRANGWTMLVAPAGALSVGNLSNTTRPEGARSGRRVAFFASSASRPCLPRSLIIGTSDTPFLQHTPGSGPSSNAGQRPGSGPSLIVPNAARIGPHGEVIMGWNLKFLRPSNLPLSPDRFGCLMFSLM
ncbi:hypothetical protein VUR80DRAFT_7143 [Thermomyces stellatus]